MYEKQKNESPKQKTATNRETKDRNKKKQISNRMYGLTNTPQMCTPLPRLPFSNAITKILLVFRLWMCFWFCFVCRSADSFSFMHNCCTYWQLVYLNVTQPGALHDRASMCVCSGSCMCLSLLRKVPFKRKYRHCLKLSPVAGRARQTERRRAVGRRIGVIETAIQIYV